MRVVKFIFDNIGNVFSANSISNFLKSEHRTVAPETIYNYLEWLTEAFVIDKVSRYDLRGKAILKTQEKYYLGDISLLYALNGRGGFESYLPGILENIVYHELISHGYTVQIGKNGEKEIDFIASRPGRTLYLQVAAHLEGAATMERAFSAFAGLEDSAAEKYVLSLDENSALQQYGALQRYLPAFILRDL